MTTQNFQFSSIITSSPHMQKKGQIASNFNTHGSTNINFETNHIDSFNLSPIRKTNGQQNTKFWEQSDLRSMSDSSFKFYSNHSFISKQRLSNQTNDPVYNGFVKSRVSDNLRPLQDLEPDNSFRGARKHGRQSGPTQKMVPLKAMRKPSDEYCHQRVEVKQNKGRLALPDSGRFYGSLNGDTLRSEKPTTFMLSQVSAKSGLSRGYDIRKSTVENGMCTDGECRMI